MDRLSLTRFSLLSILAALVTIGLKSAAYWLTGSVGLLSDALESSVNLVGAVMTMIMLMIAAQPPDEDHSYGHDKAEYFASGVEGVLIIVAALSIAVTAWKRLVAPQPLEMATTGMIISAVATLINFWVARILLGAGREYNSIALEADGRHLMTDVVTSVGVIVSVAAVAVTGWERIDPIVALVVAANIIREGWEILKRTIAGLMDGALSWEERKKIREIIRGYEKEGIQFHALRTRRSGARGFVSVHVLVPGSWTVHHGHQLLERIEADIRAALPFVTVFTHLESLDDRTSWHDMELDRPSDPADEVLTEAVTERPEEHRDT